MLKGAHERRRGGAGGDSPLNESEAVPTESAQKSNPARRWCILGIERSPITAEGLNSGQNRREEQEEDYDEEEEEDCLNKLHQNCTDSALCSYSRTKCCSSSGTHAEQHWRQFKPDRPSKHNIEEYFHKHNVYEQIPVSTRLPLMDAFFDSWPWKHQVEVRIYELRVGTFNWNERQGRISHSESRTINTAPEAAIIMRVHCYSLTLQGIQTEMIPKLHVRHRRELYTPHDHTCTRVERFLSRLRNIDIYFRAVQQRFKLFYRCGEDSRGLKSSKTGEHKRERSSKGLAVSQKSEIHQMFNFSSNILRFPSSSSKVCSLKQKLQVPSCFARLRQPRAACASLLRSNYGSVRLRLFTVVHRTVGTPAGDHHCAGPPRRNGNFDLMIGNNLTYRSVDLEHKQPHNTMIPLDA
ncbi:Hypothetical predicted protein [Xyrichtys novacula]|uniref:Uncharacterized protein n=1 Tax=Xyrichtys novacula TaxID=13765 RepID=A0AAV1GPU2_XYRNO|nr:Hypothetical predicted protein [Xyrichtys novacula]